MDIIIDTIGQYFRTQEKVDFSIQFSRYRRNAITIIQEEAEKAKHGDTVRIYAIGGEEIVFDCLNSVALFPNMQLAAIPYGDTDNFLKIFGEDKIESFKDVKTLINSNALPTDIIRWGINYALSSCCIGMNTAVSKKIQDLRSNLSKNSFIVFSKISSFFSNIISAFNMQLAARKYSVIIDSVEYSGNYSLIHVANSPYYNGRKTGVSQASPVDGLLDIVLIKASNPIKTLFSIRKYYAGKRPKNCIFIQGKKIIIHSDSQMWIQLDNEYIQDTSINLNIVHQAIQFVVPEGLSYPIGELSAL
jgi:diacylglycerol kinase family enzyme